MKQLCICDLCNFCIASQESSIISLCNCDYFDEKNWKQKTKHSFFFLYHTPSLYTESESPTCTYCNFTCIQVQRLCLMGCAIDVLSAYKMASAFRFRGHVLCDNWHNQHNNMEYFVLLFRPYYCVIRSTKSFSPREGLWSLSSVVLLSSRLSHHATCFCGMAASSHAPTATASHIIVNHDFLLQNIVIL